VKLKTRVLGAAGALALAGGMVATAMPAQAAVTPAGQCQGSVSFIKITGPTKGVGLTDQTQNGIKTAGNLAKDAGTHAAIAGSCTGTVTRPGDAHVPGGANPTLTPKSQAVSLLGNASCANGAPAQAADATAANAYPLNGKITWTFNETYNDLVTAAPKPYKMQAAVALLGFAGLDTVDVSGIVLSGADAGANVGGTIWEDPVAKGGKYRTVTDLQRTNGSANVISATAKFAATDVGGTIVGTGIPSGTTIASVTDLSHATMSANATSTGTGSATLNGDAYNTNYNLDLTNALGCATATPNDANITQVLSGGGGSSSTSVLGTTGVPGISFQFGEA
jgi:hypothetical protein